jgi:uncharacterized damage-inducible protein DinB
VSLSSSFLGELDYEMANTRKTLERVPTDKLAWQPHTKSMTLGRLASHIAEMPNWAVRTVRLPEFDFAVGGYQRLNLGSTPEIVEAFDKNFTAAREAIAGAGDEALRETWTLRRGDQVVFALPRIGVLRSMVLNHTIHHRGQLTVYLRLNDVPLPGLYGPSADEPRL